MNFYFDDDYNEEIPLMERDMPQLWAGMLEEGVRNWLEIMFLHVEA